MFPRDWGGVVFPLDFSVWSSDEQHGDNSPDGL